MNIFAVSSDPIECAQYLDNRRLNKMTVETAQLLCSAIWLREENKPTKEAWVAAGWYKPCYLKHPVTLWVAEDFSHLYWTYKLFISMLIEYQNRFKKQHGCSKILFKLSEGYMRNVLPITDNITFINCAASKAKKLDFTHIQDVHEAYKLYLAAQGVGTPELKEAAAIAMPKISIDK